jgi:hypothetical protein
MSGDELLCVFEEVVLYDLEILLARVTLKGRKKMLIYSSESVVGEFTWNSL